MTYEELSAIFSREGLYILTDDRVPGCTNAVVNIAGRAFQINPGAELSPDYGVWRSNTTTHLAGGPFTKQTIEQMDAEIDNMDRTVDRLLGLLVKCCLMLPGYRDLLARTGSQEDAQLAQRLLSELADVLAPTIGTISSQSIATNLPPSQP
jgi:hypothetical protein